MTANSKADRIIFIGQFPPPVNGLTAITSSLAEDLRNGGHKIIFCNTTSNMRSRTIVFHFFRSVRIARAILQLARNANLNRRHVCYFTAEGGLGLIHSVLIAAFARIFRYRIFIHHHSYSYIVHRRILMRIMLHCAGPEAIQISLSSQMAQNLADRYNKSIRCVIISNASFVSQPKSRVMAERIDSIVIGLLSNLSREKGIYEFIEILRDAKRLNLPIRGILAGPASNPDDKSAISSMMKELGGHLTYLGSIYGGEKTKFFEEIDVFVFPTSYLNEAQPTVIFEALANGIPIISFDRGCIRDQVGNAGHVLPKSTNFSQAALSIINQYDKNREILSRDQSAAQAQYNKQRVAGKSEIMKLFNSSPTIYMPAAIHCKVKAQ